MAYKREIGESGGYLVETRFRGAYPAGPAAMSSEDIRQAYLHPEKVEEVANQKFDRLNAALASVPIDESGQ